MQRARGSSDERRQMAQASPWHYPRGSLWLPVWAGLVAVLPGLSFLRPGFLKGSWQPITCSANWTINWLLSLGKKKEVRENQTVKWWPTSRIWLEFDEMQVMVLHLYVAGLWPEEYCYLITHKKRNFLLVLWDFHDFRLYAINLGFCPLIEPGNYSFHHQLREFKGT